MPPYLADQTATATRYMSFGMTNDCTGGSAQAGIQGRFFVDGLQFAHGCAGETLELGKVEEWQLINNSVPQHPFHIHTNPFQITWRRWTVDTNGNPIQPVIQDFEPPYPWMDTIALKPGRLNRRRRPASSTAPTTTPARWCCTATSSATRTAA